MQIFDNIIWHTWALNRERGKFCIQFGNHVISVNIYFDKKNCPYEFFCHLEIKFFELFSYNPVKSFLYFRKTTNFECQNCGIRYKHRHTLKVHLMRHSGIKPFKCKVCEKSFVRSSDLNLHQRTHQNVKEFKCETCSKYFRRSAHLKTHSRIHTGEKPYQCLWEMF